MGLVDLGLSHGFMTQYLLIFLFGAQYTPFWGSKIQFFLRKFFMIGAEVVLRIFFRAFNVSPIIWEIQILI